MVTCSFLCNVMFYQTTGAATAPKSICRLSISKPCSCLSVVNTEKCEYLRFGSTIFPKYSPRFRENQSLPFRRAISTGQLRRQKIHVVAGKGKKGHTGGKAAPNGKASSPFAGISAGVKATPPSKLQSKAEKEPPRITKNLTSSLKILKSYREFEKNSNRLLQATTSYRRKKTDRQDENSNGLPTTGADEYFPGDADVGYEPGQRPPVLLVDGYNICYYWPKLKRHMARGDLETARTNLLLDLSSYGATRGIDVICAFDAMLSGRPTNSEQFQGVEVVFTSNMADSWIEQQVAALRKDGCPRVWVATSDRAQGDFVLGKGAFLWSASYLVHEIKAAKKDLQEELKNFDKQKYSWQGKLLEHGLDESTRSALYNLRKKLSNEGK